MAKRYLKSAEECLGKTLFWASAGSSARSPVRVLKQVEEEVIEIQFLDTGNIFHFRFLPGQFYTETPDYVERWEKKLGLLS